MKPTSFFGRQPASSSFENWSADVEVCVLAGDSEGVLRLLSASNAGLNLSKGFAGSTPGRERSSLAQLCIECDKASVLRAVLSAAPKGFSYEAFTTVLISEPGDRLIVETPYSIRLAAVSRLDAAALRIGLEFDPTPLDKSESSLESETVHVALLEKALNARTESDLERHVPCLDVCIDLHVPLWRPGSASGSNLASRLFGRNHQQQLRVRLIDLYLTAGLTSVHTQVHDGASSGRYPCELAIVSGNGAAAAAAIDRGCDLKLSLPVGYDDLIAFARDFQVVDDSKTLVPLVTEALMRRHYRIQNPPAAHENAPRQMRRVQRGSL